MTASEALERAIGEIRAGRRREAHISLGQVETALGQGERVDLSRLGVAYGWCQLPGRAVTHLEAALAENPRDPGIAYKLATILRMTGALSRARELAEGLKRSRPDFIDPVLLISEVREASARDNQVDVYEHWLRDLVLSKRDQVKVFYALAREYEELGENALSFSRLEEGARIKRATLQYDVGADIAVLDTIGRTHTAESLRALGEGYHGGAPVFVVGLPRTGTTLIERTLASHDDLATVGETNALPLELVRLAREARADGPLDRIELVSAALSVGGAELGRRYCLEACPDFPRAFTADLTAPRFIDKMPLNSLYLGLIAQSLPKAGLVLLERDPMDTIYAMYKSLFDGGYPFSYRLDELAGYYVAWRRLMDHFKQLLGERLIVIQYERFVTDFATEARRLLSRLEIPWRDECLRFDLHSGPSTTLSAVQIRQPIHPRSIGRWRCHPGLGPAAEILGSAGYL